MCLRSLFKYYYVIVLHAKQSFTFKTICQRRLEHTWLHKPVDIGYLKQICNFKAVWHFFGIFLSRIPLMTQRFPSSQHLSLGTPTSHGPKVQKRYIQPFGFYCPLVFHKFKKSGSFLRHSEWGPFSDRPKHANPKSCTIFLLNVQQASV